MPGDHPRPLWRYHQWTLLSDRHPGPGDLADAPRCRAGTAALYRHLVARAPPRRRPARSGTESVARKFAHAHSRPQPGTRGGNKPGSRGGKAQSNVDIALLDPEGNVVHWFDGFSQQGSLQKVGRKEAGGKEVVRKGLIRKEVGRKRSPKNTMRQLSVAADRLGLSQRGQKVRSVTLPQLEEGQGCGRSSRCTIR